jgi:hypothetical protein
MTYAKQAAVQLGLCLRPKTVHRAKRKRGRLSNKSIERRSAEGGPHGPGDSKHSQEVLMLNQSLARCPLQGQ